MYYIKIALQIFVIPVYVFVKHDLDLFSWYSPVCTMSGVPYHIMLFVFFPDRFLAVHLTQE